MSNNKRITFIKAYDTKPIEAGIYPKDHEIKKKAELVKKGRILIPFSVAVGSSNSGIEVELPEGKTEQDIVEIYDERIDDVETGIIEFKDGSKAGFKLTPFYDLHFFEIPEDEEH